jgi:hypothetical protein
MIIVAGQIVVEPAQREAYLQSCLEVIEQARIAPEARRRTVAGIGAGALPLPRTTDRGARVGSAVARFSFG